MPRSQPPLRNPRTADSSSLGPTVVMLNSGKLDHLGPGRLWVHLARSWARVGVAVLRVDLSGLGDSPVQEGREPDVVYSPDALDDIADIAQRRLARRPWRSC